MYIFFRSLPCLICLSFMAVSLIFMANTNGDRQDFITAITIGATIMVTFFTVTIVNVCRFFSIIKRQEKIHKVAFSDKNAVVLSKFSPWLILSNDWLIRPGGFAIYIGEIEHTAILESCFDLEYKSIIYLTKIKTRSGKVFHIKIKSEKNARLIQKWARRKTSK